MATLVCRLSLRRGICQERPCLVEIITWGLVLPWVNVGACLERSLQALPICPPGGQPFGPAGAQGKVVPDHLHQWGQALCGEQTLGQSSVLWLPHQRGMHHPSHQLPTPFPGPALVEGCEGAPPMQGWLAEEAAADGGLDAAPDDHGRCLQAPATVLTGRTSPAVQGLCTALLPLVFSPLPLLFFCLRGLD